MAWASSRGLLLRCWSKKGWDVFTQARARAGDSRETFSRSTSYSRPVLPSEFRSVGTFDNFFTQLPVVFPLESSICGLPCLTLDQPRLPCC